MAIVRRAVFLIRSNWNHKPYQKLIREPWMTIRHFLPVLAGAWVVTHITFAANVYINALCNVAVFVLGCFLSFWLVDQIAAPCHSPVK